MKKSDAEIAVRAFWLYYTKYLKFHDGFILPAWFVEAQKIIGEEKGREIFAEEVPEDHDDE